MTNGKLILLIIVLVLILAIILVLVMAVRNVRRKVRNFSQAAFGTDSLVDGWQRQVKIHQTEIARYEKKQGKCVVTLQSAVEHYHYKEQNGKVIAGDDRLMEQTKYNVELMYVQDPDKANMDRSLGLTCPNCGAPITKLGASKYCEYCGSGVTPMNIQVWHLQKYYEVDYHRV